MLSLPIKLCGDGKKCGSSWQSLPKDREGQGRQNRLWLPLANLVRRTREVHKDSVDLKWLDKGSCGA